MELEEAVPTHSTCSTDLSRSGHGLEEARQYLRSAFGSPTFSNSSSSFRAIQEPQETTACAEASGTAQQVEDRLLSLKNHTDSDADDSVSIGTIEDCNWEEPVHDLLTEDSTTVFTLF